MTPFLAYVIPVSGGAPDNTLPGGGGYPDNTLPGGGVGIWPRPPSPGRPDQGLPRPPHYPDQGLPGGGGHPDQGLPGGGGYPDQGLPGQPGHPDQGLPPSAQPKPAARNIPPKPAIPPSGSNGTYVLVMVAPGVAKWAWVAGGGQVDNTLPEGQPGPDQGLPDQPGAQPKS